MNKNDENWDRERNCQAEMTLKLLQQSWLLLPQTSVPQEHIFDSLTLSHTGHVFYVKFLSRGAAKGSRIITIL